ncbi:MAG TPA: YbhB/YbcL family Raf kinase inhibitor-like protein [Caulobacteraceae bacterium]|nr:YbhB/YbcL family Raf kinase inhibitor-like protein [Caulobacteraceae bacterium]
MLGKLPAGIGHALRGVRAGYEKIVAEREGFAQVADVIALESPAFEDGGSIPIRYTADGEGVSPPLRWSGPIAEAPAAALIVEDPDSPSPRPLVHLLVWDLSADRCELPEGQLASPGHAGLDETLGRNSNLHAAWIPPDPPPGHGPHLYVFQIFALDRKLDFARPPTRARLVRAMLGHVTAKAVLVGTYERP